MIVSINDTIGAATVQPLQSLKQANKGLEGGWLPSGRRSSVAEPWRLKPEALGSIPGGATFPFKPLPFQRSTDGGGPDCVVD